MGPCARPGTTPLSPNQELWVRLPDQSSVPVALTAFTGHSGDENRAALTFVRKQLGQAVTKALPQEWPSTGTADMRALRRNTPSRTGGTPVTAAVTSTRPESGWRSLPGRGFVSYPSATDRRPAGVGDGHHLEHKGEGPEI